MNRKWERELLIVLTVCLPFIFWGLGSVSLLDPDEGLYGSIAREMAETGDWITPHFNGLRYLEKPPLYFWLTALTFTLFGPSEWGTRLWSAVPMLGTAILTWRIGGLLYGGLAGILSAIVLVTNAAVFRYTRVAATDCLLVFSLALSLYGFIRTMLDHRSDAKPIRLGPILFYLGMALGVLSKGLIGAVFPLLIAGLYLWFSGDRITIKYTQWKWGLVLFLGLTLPWHLLAAWKNPGFFEFYVIDNQFLRFLSNRAYIEDDVPVGAVAFLALTWIWFFPWSLFLAGTLRHGFPNASLGQPASDRLRLLIGLWAVIVLGFFSLSSLTLEHYFLPAMPPLSLLVGALWAEALSAGKPLPSLKWSLIASAVGCSLVGIGLIYLSDRLTSEAIFAWLAKMNVYYRILKEQGASFPYASISPFVPLVKGAGIALAIGLPLSLLFFCLRGYRASFVVVTGVAAVIALMVFRLLFIIEPHHSAKSVALALTARTQQGEPIIHEGPLEYSGGLPFYTGRQIYVLNGRRGDLEFGSRSAEGKRLFLDDEGFARRWNDDERVFLVTRLQEGKSILKRLSLEQTFFLGQYGGRSLYSNYGS